MTKKIVIPDEEWGNIELPGLSDQELYAKNWNKVEASLRKHKDQEFRKKFLETREKLSKIHKGKKPHQNTNIGASNKNSKRYLFVDIDGNEVDILNMRQFCVENGLSPIRMCQIIKNPHHNYKGWKFIKMLKKL
jgi:hypothetical protein